MVHWQKMEARLALVEHLFKLEFGQRCLSSSLEISHCATIIEKSREVEQTK